MLETIAASWRGNRIMLRMGLIEIKWLAITFLLSATIAFLVAEVLRRRLERQNRTMRLILAAREANKELRRLGSSMQIDLEHD